MDILVKPYFRGGQLAYIIWFVLKTLCLCIMGKFFFHRSSSQVLLHSFLQLLIKMSVQKQDLINQSCITKAKDLVIRFDENVMSISKMLHHCSFKVYQELCAGKLLK